jgi:hypothetical protein
MALAPRPLSRRSAAPAGGDAPSSAGGAGGSLVQSPRGPDWGGAFVGTAQPPLVPPNGDERPAGLAAHRDLAPAPHNTPLGATTAEPAPPAALQGRAPRATLARRPAPGAPSTPVASRPSPVVAAPARRPLAAAPARTLARAAADAPAAGTGGAGGGGGGGGGDGGGGGGGGDGDQVFSEVMRRVREEQEQLGKLISHPF